MKINALKLAEHYGLTQLLPDAVYREVQPLRLIYENLNRSTSGCAVPASDALQRASPCQYQLGAVLSWGRSFLAHFGHGYLYSFQV
jgi:hypothetical protein